MITVNNDKRLKPFIIIDEYFFIEEAERLALSNSLKEIKPTIPTNLPTIKSFNTLKTVKK